MKFTRIRVNYMKKHMLTSRMPASHPRHVCSQSILNIARPLFYREYFMRLPRDECSEPPQSGKSLRAMIGAAVKLLRVDYWFCCESGVIFRQKRVGRFISSPAVHELQSIPEVDDDSKCHFVWARRQRCKGVGNLLKKKKQIFSHRINGRQFQLNLDT